MRTVVLTTLAAAAVAVVAPSMASAQTYGRQVPVECQQSVNNNRLAGGVIGALGGALAGRSVASRGTRDEGAILGAVVGAVAGSEIGKRRVACDDAYRAPPTRTFRSQSYNNGYAQPTYGYVQPQYGYGQPAYPTHQTGWNQPIYSAPTIVRNNCGWGEAQLRNPDGLVQRQQVWMCLDRRGQWQVAG